MGGELFNSGAVEMRKLAELTGLPGGRLVAKSAGINLLACSTALTAFWFMSVRRHRRRTVNGGEPDHRRKNRSARRSASTWSRPSCRSCRSPFSLSTSSSGARSPLRSIAGPPKILTAMLIGVVAAGLTSRKSAGGLAPAFFEGAGYAYYNVISLIVRRLHLRGRRPAERSDRGRDPVDPCLFPIWRWSWP